MTQNQVSIEEQARKIQKQFNTPKPFKVVFFIESLIQQIFTKHLLCAKHSAKVLGIKNKKFMILDFHLLGKQRKKSHNHIITLQLFLILIDIILI